jgi:hypothetical protein
VQGVLLVRARCWRLLIEPEGRQMILGAALERLVRHEVLTFA